MVSKKMDELDQYMAYLEALALSLEAKANGVRMALNKLEAIFDPSGGLE